jgi:hypothetical protein
LFEKNYYIPEDSVEFVEFKQIMPNNNFSVIDNIHRWLLEYMIKKNIETGTLEVK